MGIFERFQGQRRSLKRAKKQRTSANVQVAELRERERELRRSGPQSSLRRVGLAPASDAGLPRLGSSASSLLTGGDTILPFNQRRRR